MTVTLAQREGATVAWVVVRTPQPLSPEQVAHLNDMVNHTTGTAVLLHVRSVITAETGLEGDIYEPVFQPTDKP